MELAFATNSLRLHPSLTCKHGIRIHSSTLLNKLPATTKAISYTTRLKKLRRNLVSVRSMCFTYIPRHNGHFLSSILACAYICDSFEAAQQNLANRSILAPSQNGYKVHGSFQTQILFRLSVAERRDRFAWATSLVFNQTPQQRDGHSLVSKWAHSQQWLPMVKTLFSQIAGHGFPNTSTEEFANDMTQYMLVEIGRNWAVMLLEQGRYLDANNMFQKSFFLSERLVHSGRDARRQGTQSVGGGNLEKPGISLSTLLVEHSDLTSLLGTIAIERNQMLLAVSMMKKTWELRREARDLQAHGNEDLLQVQESGIKLARNNLAAACIIAGEDQQALDLLQDLYRESKSEFRPRWRGNQALCLLQLGRLQEAHAAIEVALSMKDTSEWELAR